ncbi:hypothetical protein Hanom_Chr11g01012491 [Helianthus anomalus]
MLNGLPLITSGVGNLATPELSISRNTFSISNGIFCRMRSSKGPSGSLNPPS